MPRARLLVACALLACGDDGQCLGPAASDAPSGARVWQQAFTATMYDHGAAVAVDPCSGRVAVGGSLEPHTSNSTSDIWIGVTSHDGEPRWDTRIHEKFDDYARAVAFTADGSLVVAGTSSIGVGPGSNSFAAWLARFTPDGEELWRASLHEADDDMSAYSFDAVTVASDGRIFLAGRKYSYYVDYTVAAAYDPDGARVFFHEGQRDGGEGRLLAAFVLADDAVLYVGGRIVYDTADDLLLLQRYTRDGELESATDHPDVPAPWSAAAIAPDHTSLLLGAGEWLGEVSLTGDLLRELTLSDDESLRAIAVADDAVYIAGGDILGLSKYTPWVRRLDRDFTRVWAYLEDRRGSIEGLALGPTGDVFLAGSLVAPPPAGATDFNNYDVWIARIAR